LRESGMTKAEQARIVAWQLRILKHAEEEPRYVRVFLRVFKKYFSNPVLV
jgi:hypothetical protein